MKLSLEQLSARMRQGETIPSRQTAQVALALSIPSILEQLVVTAMGYIDAAMVGHIGAEATASIGIVSSSTWLLHGVLVGLYTALSIQIAQYLGADRQDDARSVLRQAMLFNVILGVGAALFGLGISPFLPGWLGADPSLRANATAYFAIWSTALPFTMAMGMYTSILRAAGYALTASLISVLVCVLDAIFNFFLINPTRTLWGITVWGAGLGVPGAALGTALATVVGGLLVCSGGVQKGLEKVTKIMMVCLLALIVVLAVHSLTLSGAGKGIDFYLRPNMDTIRSVGIFNVITNAMNQAFFTLSLGIAAMEIFGSYMHDDHTLTGEAVRICALDTFVAIMAGLIIFPACFSYNVELDHGPALIFMTLPKIFLDMPGGRVWGSLFFLFMTFASFSTVTAVFENLIASACDNWGWSRKKSVGIVGAVLFLASIPCVLGYNVWSSFHPMPGKDILDFEDFLVSSLLLPIGSLVYLLFCVSKRGWGFDKYLAECNKGTGIKMSPKFKVYFRYILPILIIIILVVGLVPLFR